MNNMRGPSNFGPRPNGGPMFGGGFRGPPPGPGGFMGPDNGPRGMRGPPPFGGQFDNFRPPLNQGQGMMGPDMNMHGNHPPMGPGGFGPPGNMQGPMGPGGPMQDHMVPPPPQNAPNIDHNKEIWVETLSDEGKIYYYNAKTRQSVWKKPSDENVQIIKQNEVQSLANPNFSAFPAKNDRAQGNNKQGKSNNEQINDENQTENSNQADNKMNEEKDGNIDENKEENEDGEVVNEQMMQNPPFVGGGELINGAPIRMMVSGSGPMPGMPMQRGVVPLMMPMRPMVPGMMPRMGLPPNIMPHPMMTGPPGIIPLGGVVEWREHTAPDGRVYFYNMRTMETRWERPKELEMDNDMNDGNMEEKMVTSKDNFEVKKSELTDEQKAKQQQRPVATKPVPGTPWCVVWTGDEKVFFFNPTTKLSLWEKPNDLIGRLDVDRILADPPHKRKLEEETSDPVTLSQEPMSDQPQLKKKKTDEEKKMTEAEKLAEEERAAQPLEVRTEQFRQMLQERQVSAFSTWEKELHKIVFDPRHTLLNAKERKTVFDEYVKNRAEEERKEKKAMLLKARESFKDLVHEVNLNSKMSFSEFAAKNSKDPRFRGIDKMRERESLFNECAQSAKKKKEQESRSKADKIKKDYFALMEENKVEKYSRWSKAKSKLSSDARFNAVESSYQREQWWEEYARQHSVEDEDAGRKRRAEESLKARAEEVEREKAERTREIDSERQKHRLDEAVQHFKALLADMVRNTDLSWSETRRILRKDGRWELATLLSKEDKEKYFMNHIDNLHKKKRSIFKTLLEETGKITVTTKWKEARKLVKHDPRFAKFSSSDRKREREFEDFIKELVNEAKFEFRDLLRECKLITHKTKENIRSNSQSMKEIISFLENDKRYLNLESIDREREDLLKTYIDDLHRRGPPPPPTATEPSRRDHIK
ncbi:transcription elongation regulator 1 [Ciona intestinalis]